MYCNASISILRYTQKHYTIYAYASSDGNNSPLHDKNQESRILLAGNKLDSDIYNNFLLPIPKIYITSNVAMETYNIRN